MVRLWQGGSQVEAPVLEFNQKQRRLVARGDGTGAAMAVHTVLVSAGAAGRGEQGTEQAAGNREQETGNRTGRVGSDLVAVKGSATSLRGPAVVRVASREMVYSEAQRTAEFTGGVRVESADGVMKGDRATAYLEGAAASAPSNAGKNSSSDKLKKKVDAGAGFLAGGVERVVVAGAISIDQPGRHATGERLVYTAGDGLLVLTGTDAAPPRVVDQARGAVTGAELRFRAEDESVVISNGDKSGAGLRVHTETRVKRDR
jgi:lipopolysaccharide export system protein LptA